MKSGQITIKDIARELNISPSTVSRALKNHPDISKETRVLVQELAHKLDYQPNAVALSLRKSKTNIIGVIIPKIVHHFFSTVISGIEDVVNDAGFHVMICQSNESYQREISNVHALLSSRVDGFLVSISGETKQYDHFQSILNRDIPLVFFDRACESLNTSSVLVDDFEGAFKAVEHLIFTGRKRIAHLAGPDHLLISRERKNGYMAALQKHGLPVEDSLIIPCGLTLENGVEAFSGFLKTNMLPDAIFSAADPSAIGAMLVIKEKGWHVPDEIAIVGFSDEPLTSLIDPSLSSVYQPGYEMGQIASRMLLNQIQDKNAIKEQVVLKTGLIIRKSSQISEKISTGHVI